MVRDSPDAQPQTVVVKIPVLGPYSATWPLNCKKSDTIVANLANGEHSLELAPIGEGALQIEAFDIFTPPLQ